MWCVHTYIDFYKFLKNDFYKFYFFLIVSFQFRKLNILILKSNKNCKRKETYFILKSRLGGDITYLHRHFFRERERAIERF